MQQDLANVDDYMAKTTGAHKHVFVVSPLLP